MKTEPNWNAFKKATGIELEVILLKKRIELLEEKLELLLNGQKDKEKVSKRSSEV